MHCQNVRVVLNFAETVHTRNKSHAKFKAYTLPMEDGVQVCISNCLAELYI